MEKGSIGWILDYQIQHLMQVGELLSRRSVDDLDQIPLNHTIKAMSNEKKEGEVTTDSTVITDQE